MGEKGGGRLGPIRCESTPLDRANLAPVIMTTKIAQTWNLVEILWFIFKYFSAQFMAQFSSFLLTFLLVKSQTQSLKQISLNLL